MPQIHRTLTTLPLSSDFKKFTPQVIKFPKPDSKRQDESPSENLAENPPEKSETPLTLAPIVPLRSGLGGHEIYAISRLRIDAPSLFFIQFLEKLQGSRYLLFRFVGARTYQTVLKIQKNSYLRKGAIIDQQAP